MLRHSDWFKPCTIPISDNHNYRDISHSDWFKTCHVTPLANRKLTKIDKSANQRWKRFNKMGSLQVVDEVNNCTVECTTTDSLWQTRPFQISKSITFYILPAYSLLHTAYLLPTYCLLTSYILPTSYYILHSTCCLLHTVYIMTTTYCLHTAY